MNRDTLVKQLYDLSNKIAAAEGDAVKSAEALADAEEALLVAEDLLLTEGKLDGKNPETREAQGRQLTAAPRAIVRETRRAHARNAGRLRVLLAHFQASGNVAKLLERSEDPRA